MVTPYSSKPNNRGLFDILADLLGEEVSGPDFSGMQGMINSLSTDTIKGSLADSTFVDPSVQRANKNAKRSRRRARRQRRQANKAVAATPASFVEPSVQRAAKKAKKNIQRQIRANKEPDGPPRSNWKYKAPKAKVQAPQRRRAVRKQNDNMTDFLQDYLAQKMATVGGTFDYESALRESEQAIKEAYARDIKAVRGSNQAARRDTAANRKDVEALYAALSRSYADNAQEALGQGQELAGMMQDTTQETAGSIQDIAAQIASQQAELASGLGLPEVTADYMPQQAENVQKQLAALSAEGSEDANRQLGFAGNQQRWLMRGANNANLEGTNRSAELIRDLQDFVQGNRTQISEMQGLRGREIANNKSEIMSAVAEQQAAQDEALWKQMMDFSNLKLDIEDTQADNRLANRKHRFTIRDANREAKQWASEQGLKEAQFNWDRKTDKWDRKLDSRKLELEALKAASRGEEDAESWVPGYFQDYSQALQEMNPRARQVAQSMIGSKPFQHGAWTDKDAKREFKLNPTSAAALAEDMAKEAGITNPKQIALIKLAAMVYAKGGV